MHSKLNLKPMRQRKIRQTPLSEPGTVWAQREALNNMDCWGWRLMRRRKARVSWPGICWYPA